MTEVEVLGKVLLLVGVMGLSMLGILMILLLDIRK